MTIRITPTIIVLVCVIIVLGAGLIYMWSTRGSKDNFEPAKHQQQGQQKQKVAPPPPAPKPHGSPSGSTRIDTTTHSATLLGLFATWCPHCTAMAGDWKKVEAALDGKVEVLELESKHVDMPKFNPSGFPTIRFYPKGTVDEKNYVEYKGPRVAANIISFALNGGR